MCGHHPQPSDTQTQIQTQTLSPRPPPSICLVQISAFESAGESPQLKVKPQRSPHAGENPNLKHRQTGDPVCGSRVTAPYLLRQTGIHGAPPVRSASAVPWLQPLPPHSPTNSTRSTASAAARRPAHPALLASTNLSGGGCSRNLRVLFARSQELHRISVAPRTSREAQLSCCARCPGAWSDVPFAGCRIVSGQRNMNVSAIVCLLRAPGRARPSGKSGEEGANSKSSTKFSFLSRRFGGFAREAENG